MFNTCNLLDIIATPHCGVSFVCSTDCGADEELQLATTNQQHMTVLHCIATALSSKYKIPSVGSTGISYTL